MTLCIHPKPERGSQIGPGKLGESVRSVCARPEGAKTRFYAGEIGITADGHKGSRRQNRGSVGDGRALRAERNYTSSVEAPVAHEGSVGGSIGLRWPSAYVAGQTPKD